MFYHSVQNVIYFIAGHSIVSYNSSPLMRRQKIDNINLCLILLQKYGCPVDGILAEGKVKHCILHVGSLT